MMILFQWDKGAEWRRICCWMALLFALSDHALPIYAQVRQTPTPITANLFTPTPRNRQQFAPTVTPTFTATPPGTILLEARESAGNVNVRAAPDLDSERLGSIAFGTRYPLLRQYFRWYELAYDLSPTGKAWVYDELVEVIGDANRIKVIDALVVDIEITQTAIAIETVPGAKETATANARVLNAPTASEADVQGNGRIAATAPPTFTYPPDILAAAPTLTVMSDSANGNDSDLPPLFPILMLGGFGSIGLLIYSIRR